MEAFETLLSAGAMLPDKDTEVEPVPSALPSPFGVARVATDERSFKEIVFSALWAQKYFLAKRMLELSPSLAMVKSTGTKERKKCMLNQI